MPDIVIFRDLSVRVHLTTFIFNIAPMMKFIKHPQYLESIRWVEKHNHMVLEYLLEYSRFFFLPDISTFWTWMNSAYIHGI